MNEKDGPKGLIANINAWWAHPFNAGGSATNWWLFIGLLLVFVLFWQIILLQLTKEL